MNASDEKFNFLVIIFSILLVVSLFSGFSVSYGIYGSLFLIMSIVFIFHFNSFSINSKALFPALLFAAAVITSYYFADYKYNVGQNILLLSSALSVYGLFGFLNAYARRSLMIIPVFIALWLTIYLFAVNLASPKLFAGAVAAGNAPAPSCFLLCAMCLSFIFWWNQKRIHIYASFIIFAAIFLTKSYFAAAIASLAFASFLFFMREKIIVRAYLTIAPFIAFFLAALFFLHKTDFFKQVFLRWQTAFIIIKDNWLWGTGFGNYASAAFPYAQENGGYISDAGNIFLKIFAETGIFGLCAFLAVLCVFFYCVFKKLKLFENKELLLPVLLAVISFLTYGFFDSSVFVSTNIILFFILAAFPISEYETLLRKKKINFYLLAVCLIPLFVSIIKPVYAQRQYQKGISFFTAQKYFVAYDYYLSALNNDCLNPEYAAKISDNYFALYQDSKNDINLNAAIEYEKYALSLNPFNAKYYAQLAWLYHFKGEKELASQYISKAVEMDKLSQIYRQAYGELIY